MVWAGSPSGILSNSPRGSLRLASQETPAVRHAVLHDPAVFRFPTRLDKGLVVAVEEDVADPAGRILLGQFQRVRPVPLGGDD
jgi:hypothetical protein